MPNDRMIDAKLQEPNALGNNVKQVTRPGKVHFIIDAHTADVTM